MISLRESVTFDEPFCKSSAKYDFFTRSVTFDELFCKSSAKYDFFTRSVTFDEPFSKRFFQNKNAPKLAKA